MFRTSVFIALAGFAALGLDAQPLQLMEVANIPGGYLGVMGSDVSPERAKTLKLPEAGGVEITFLEAGSAAAAAGLRLFDVVMQYNGQRVEGINQLSRMIQDTAPGHEVKLQIYRNGVAQTITAKVSTHPDGIIIQGALIPGVPLTSAVARSVTDMPLPRMSWRIGGLGVEVEAIETQLADYFGVKEGVLVRSVIKGSAGDRAGLKAGDIITRIGDARVATPADLSTHIQTGRALTAGLAVVRDKKEMSVSVLLDAGGTRAFVQ